MIPHCALLHQSSYITHSEAAGVTQYSPYWIYDESSDKESHAKYSEEEVTQALVLSIVGQLGCLKKKITEIKHKNNIRIFLK